MARPQWCALPQASIATMQRGCSAKKPRTFSRESFLRNPMPPSTRAPCAWKDRLARSRPMMLTFSMDASPFVGCENITTLAHRDAVRRGIHSITRPWPRRGAACSSSAPVAQAGVITPHLVRRPPNRALQQMSDLVLQDLVGRKPDRVACTFGFKKLVDLGIGESGIAPEIQMLHDASITRDHRLQHRAPAVSTVDVARP